METSEDDDGNDRKDFRWDGFLLDLTVLLVGVHPFSTIIFQLMLYILWGLFRKETNVGAGVSWHMQGSIAWLIALQTFT
jgi:hypothetical protein